MAKIYTQLKISTELIKSIKSESIPAIDIKSFIPFNHSATIKIHSWQAGDTEIKISDILYIHSCDGNCFIHLADGKIKIHKRTLVHYQKALGDKNFLRVHQSYLVNLMQIQNAMVTNGLLLLLKNNECIPVSVRAEKKIRQLFRTSILSVNWFTFRVKNR